MRMDQDFILVAFRQGAGMVLVGLPPAGLPLYPGSRWRKSALRGCRAPRSAWASTPSASGGGISAAEGDKYARVISEMDAKLQSFDKEQLRAENRAGCPEIANGCGAGVPSPTWRTAGEGWW